MDPVYLITKVCASCKRQKPLSEFHKMKMTPDGLRPSCKACRRERDSQPKIIVQRPLFIFSKVCTMCNKEKAIEQFNNSSSTKDGYHVYCRQCQSERNQQLRIENLEAYRTRDHAKNAKPEYKAGRRKRYQQRSYDPQILEQRRLYGQKHRQKYPQEAKDFAPRRRALILNATVGKVDYSLILERDGYACHICQKPIDPHARKRSAKSLSFDHVIPLKSRPGEPQGSHSNENLKPAHYACNTRKGNRPMDTLTLFDRRGVD